MPSQQLTNAFAFGSTMLASAMLNNIFVSYYMEYFMKVVQISSSAFYIGQIIFMIWNSVNDLMFGWISDMWSPTTVDGKRNRLPAIRWGGFLWAAAFLVVWFPWGESELMQGLHFAFALCFYDGMLTYVEVNHAALLADITVDSHERADYNMYSAFCAAFGSLSSFFGHMCWGDAGGAGDSAQPMASFRVFCVAVAAVSCVCFEFTARFLARYQHLTVPVPTEMDNVRLLKLKHKDSGAPVDSSHGSNSGNSNDSISSSSAGGRSSGSDTGASLNPLTYAKQLSSHTNFLVVAGLATLQQFDCTFGKNFFTLFLATMVSTSMSPFVHSVVLAASFVLPWLSTVSLTSYVQRVGIYRSLTDIFRARLALLVCAMPLLFLSPTGGGGDGRSQDGGGSLASAAPSVAAVVADGALGVAAPPAASVLDTAYDQHLAWATVLLLLCNRVVSEAVCRLLPLVKSDLVDEDMFLHKRAQSMSGSIVGTLGFFSRPSQSFAPMLGYWLLGAIVLGSAGGATAADAAATVAAAAGGATAAADALVDAGAGAGASMRAQYQMQMHTDLEDTDGELGEGLEELWLLSRHGNGTGVGGSDAGAGAVGGVGVRQHWQYMSSVLVLVPMLVVVSQVFLWTLYTLHGEYMHTVKQWVKNQNKQRDLTKSDMAV